MVPVKVVKFVRKNSGRDRVLDIPAGSDDAVRITLISTLPLYCCSYRSNHPGNRHQVVV
jgi:hypothetical protein